MARDLDDEIAPRLVHEIEHNEVRAGRNAVERRAVARIQFHRALCVRAARIARALAARLPWRADAADEIDAGVERVRQRGGDLACADVLGHARSFITERWPKIFRSSPRKRGPSSLA